MFCLDLLNNKEHRTAGSARERLRELLEHEEPTPPLTSMRELSLLFFSFLQAKLEWSYGLLYHNRLLLG